LADAFNQAMRLLMPIKVLLLLFLLQGMDALGLDKQVKGVMPASFTKSSQTISFGYLPDRRFGDSPFLLTATASSHLPVQFSVASGPAIINNQTVILTGSGKVIIRASQVGNDDYYPAHEVERYFNVNKANQWIVFPDITSRTMMDSPFQIAATASSGFPVELNISAGPATVSGNTVHLTGEGLVTIRAYQAGNADYNSAPYVSQTFNVTKVNQQIVFSDLSEKVQAGDDFQLTAVSSSGLPVTCRILSGPATMRTSTLVTMQGIGKVRVRAYQEGNHVYYPSTIDSFFCIRPIRPFIRANGLVLNSSSWEGNQWFLDDQLIEGADTRTITVSRDGNYTVQIANTESVCSPSYISLPYELRITSLAESGEEGWTLSPNPARDYLRIQFKGASSAKIKCILYTHTGKAVLEKAAPADKEEEYRLPVSHLKPGLYLLQIIADKQITRKKVVIE
jgi:hypothetical protein